MLLDQCGQDFCHQRKPLKTANSMVDNQVEDASTPERSVKTVRAW